MQSKKYSGKLQIGYSHVAKMFQKKNTTIARKIKKEGVGV